MTCLLSRCEATIFVDREDTDIAMEAGHTAKGGGCIRIALARQEQEQRWYQLFTSIYG